MLLRRSLVVGLGVGLCLRPPRVDGPRLLVEVSQSVHTLCNIK